MRWIAFSTLINSVDLLTLLKPFINSSGQAIVKMANNLEIQDEAQKKVIKSRYTKEINQIQALGFTEEYYVSYTLPPLSAVLLFPFLILSYAFREIFRITFKLEIISFTPCFIHEDFYCYADISAEGVTYTTMFVNGAILQTSSFDTFATRMDQNRVRRGLIQHISKQNNIAEAWQQHQTTVEEWTARGHEALSLHTIIHVFEVKTRIEEIIEGKVAVTWPSGAVKPKTSDS